MEFEGLSILIAVITLVFLSIFIIILFVLFQKRKNALLLEQKEADQRFEQEIAQTQIEIREETFRNISWELHDNIGQLITLAKIQIQDPEKIQEVKNTLDISLKELRALSKMINPDALKKMSLVEALRQEIERFNRLNFIKATLNIKGEERTINSKTEIIFFRILQEFFSNTIRHAKASNLDVIVNYEEDQLQILAKDNGQGFETSEQDISGIGLTNIRKRASLVNAEIEITSKINFGTTLEIIYSYQ